jgi:AcrR family transcriptional regulator
MSERARSGADRTGRYLQKRDVILAAASEVFNRRGLKGATLADVARQAEINANSLTYYYPRKESLAADCVTRTIERLDELVAASMTERSVSARVQAFFQRWFAQLADIAEGRQAELITLYDLRALSGAHFTKAAARYADFFRSARGLIDDPSEGASRLKRNLRTALFVGLTHGVRTWVERYESDDYARTGERMADVLLSGLLKEHIEFPPLNDESCHAADEEQTSQRDLFLRAATKLINQQGYVGASVDKICARLNVTKGAFYHHISAKDDLVTDCFNRSFGIIRKAQAAAKARSGNFASQLVWCGASLVRHQLSVDGPLLRYTALAAVPEAIRSTMRRDMERLTERYAGMVADGIGDGSLRPVDATIAAHMLDTAINTAAELREWQPREERTAAHLDGYLLPLLEGLVRSR